MNETFRPRSNFAWAITSYILITLFALNTLWVIEDNLKIIRDLIVCALLSALVYIFWIKPKLVLGAEAIQVVNPFRTVSIAYGDVIDLETKWSLAIVHEDGKTRVWVAPASGKQRWVAEIKFGWIGGNSARSAIRSPQSTGMESMSASLDSLSGQAAYIIRERMKRSH